MYKIMIADDEGIVIESLTFIIEKKFGNDCVIKSARTGRAVIELAQEFRPDIVFMDIKMPGINGIDAIREIKKNNSSTIFIVMSAYDKFTYAKESINLRVFDYLMKPTNKNKIISTLERAINTIDEERARRKEDLIIKEKLGIIVPILENGMIYSILLQENSLNDAYSFNELLNIKDKFGFVFVIQYGDLNENGDLTNPVGVSVKVQSLYPKMRELIKESFEAIIGPVMINQVISFVPYSKPYMDDDEVAAVIEKARHLIRRLSKHIDLNFKIGIGSVKSQDEFSSSYKEAITALRRQSAQVIYYENISDDNSLDYNYQQEVDSILIFEIKKGHVLRAHAEAETCFDSMVSTCEEHGMDIRAKVFELILQIENLAFNMGVEEYNYFNRGKCLNTILQLKSNNELKKWFLDKTSEIITNIMAHKQIESNEVIVKAKEYIANNYNKDISLDSVATYVDKSPYYFSKLFKDETGENFIDYLTNIRIEKAKEMLSNKELSIKEICINVGYSDPNYFSRTFKKCIGITPSEYREGIV
ncbi:MAG: response regulator [Acetivibrionales bacterium]|jgi:two-component system response regulator YesN